MSAPSADTLRTFFDAPDVDTWLTQELTRSLADDLDPEAAELLVNRTREQASAAADAFLSTEVEPHEVVSTILAFARPGEGPEGAAGGVFTSTIEPIALLELAANQCEPLDEVVVSHRFASGEEVTLSHTWPFGLSNAVDLLTPGLKEPELSIPAAEIPAARPAVDVFDLDI